MSLFINLSNNFRLISKLKYPKIRVFLLSSLNSILDIIVIALFGLFISSILTDKKVIELLNFKIDLDLFIKNFFFIIFFKFIFSITFLKYLQKVNKKALDVFLFFIKNTSYKGYNLNNKKSNIELRLTTTDVRHLIPAIIMPIVLLFSDVLVIFLVTCFSIYQFKFIGIISSIIFILFTIIFLNFAKKSVAKKNISEVSDKLISLYGFFFNNKPFLSTMNANEKFSDYIYKFEDHITYILSRLQFRKTIFRPAIEFIIIFFGLLMIFLNLGEFFLIFLLIIRAIPSVINIANMVFSQNVYSKISIDFFNLMNEIKIAFNENFLSNTENNFTKLVSINAINKKTGQEIKIQNNKINCIVGKSGVGKTTLLNEICSIIPKNFWNFHIYFEDRPISKDIEIFKKNIIYLPQEFGGDNLFLYELLDILSIKQDIFLKNSEFLFPKFSIDYFKRSISTFSGGEKQRIYFTCAIIMKKNIFLFDEPTNGLEKDKAEDVIKLLHKIKNNSLIIIVSHDDYLIHLSDNIINID